MSRSDQYIGLTNDAKEFVKTLEHAGFYSIEGAFYNQIELGVWASKDKGPNGHYTIYIEKVQNAPWSSGPMYFTHLEVDYRNGGFDYFFSWSVNPLLKGGQEYDPVKGQYYV